jgi:catechol 2,3-dioxygenase-like lactoylglutathione lyase family enzyme
MTAHAIRQVAYFVPDAVRAARDHVRQFGSGPYFLAEHIPLRKALHRGREALLDHTSAYGQWGEVMIEFVQQNNPGPSAFHDMYPEGSGRSGFHHIALIVDDLPAARREFHDGGLTEALYAEMSDGFAFVMVDDVARHGHMIELYEGVSALTSFYTMVKDAAKGFDGADPIRPISFG